MNDTRHADAAIARTPQAQYDDLADYGIEPDEPRPMRRTDRYDDDDATRFAELLGPLATNAELLARAKPPNFLIRNFLTAGTLSIWAAPEKAWKTTLGVHTALCVAGHGKFLGLYEPYVTAPVVFFSGESGDWPLKSMQERILDWVYPGDVIFGEPISLRPDPATIPIHWGGDPPDLGHIDTIPALTDLIARTGAKLLILDPSQAMFGSISEDVKNDFAMRQYLKRLQLLARESGCAVVLLHHFRQHVQPGFPKRSDASYGAFTKFCDTWILMNQREEPTGDEEPGSGKLWITWGSRDGFGGSHAIDIAEGTVDTGRYFTLEVSDVGPALDALAERQAERKESATKATRQATTHQRRDAVVTALTGRVAGVTRDTLAGCVGVSRQCLAPVVAAMLEAGELVVAPCEYNNHGRACWTNGLALPATLPGIIATAKKRGWKADQNGTVATVATGVNP